MAARDLPENFPQMADALHLALRHQLENRREVLGEVLAKTQGAQLMHLLHEVDSALDRLEGGSYGICEMCHESVEDHPLLTNPLVRFCLDHLSQKEQGALEKDLERAAQIQMQLLPERDLRCDGWHVAYYYKPLGVVSGDYCDLVIGPESQLYFMVGDVAGKGVAASMLMSNLSAIFRALIPLGLPLAELMESANRIFTGSTLPTQFATLICGRAMADGALELCSAGHVPALVVTGDSVEHAESHGLPIGLFGEQRFTTSAFELLPGSSLVLFSDGISEAHRFWRILLSCDGVFKQFRARFLGKNSPVQFFWGSFDLAVTRFSGRRAPERPGADPITREAYSHKVISAGWWPGGSGVDGPAFYCYAAPAPEGLEPQAVRLEAAFYHPEIKEFVLMYDNVRGADSPEQALLDFLQSTYEVAAVLAKWNREELETDSRAA